MSSDEIRKLAQLPSVQFGGYYSPAEKNMIRATLLAYAAMVERCEAKLYSMRFDHYSPEIDDVKDFIKEMLVYIIRGDAGKEEK